MDKHYTEQKISDWIIDQNNQYIVLSKPPGMPVQKDLTPETDLQTLASIYTKNNLHLVNRVDRPASGLVLMAKSPDAVTKLSKSMMNPENLKEYLVIIEVQPNEDDGEIISFLKKGRNNKSVVSNSEKEGYKRAVLRYKKLISFDKYALLSVQIDTGRFHQIRAQLSANGMLIKGDVKYGARRKNRDRSIALHAWKMKVQHPISKEVKTYVAPLPKNDILWSIATAKLDN